MPLTPLKRLAENFLKRYSDRYWIPADTDEATKLMDLITESFDVSTAAAKVRLKKLGFLQNILEDNVHAIY